MPDQTGTVTLLPWVRQGVTAGALPVETLGDTLKSRASLDVGLRVNADTVGVKARLYGPGDVTGIDARQIVRTDPRPRSANVEPKYLASVEFARADFPWLFTPAAADAQGRLRPWLCLVVVRRRDGVRIFADENRPLPTLEIASPAKVSEELPDLAESWAWAHAQATGTALTDGGGNARSRLLCPRRLDPNTAYIACVVSTFEVGRLAGLGRPLTTDELAPAWRIGDPALTMLELPVYYTWEFSTGAGDDFETLVKKLVARDLPATVGIRPMDVTNADPDLPSIPADSPDAVLGLEGALMSRRTQPKGFTTSIGPVFREALRHRLLPPLASTTDPIVAPPIYGGRHANETGLPAESAEPNWLRDLNLDPRYRAAAALGTAVVQAHQEELMAAAWDQLGEIERINQILRQAQLLRAANQAVHRNRLKQLPGGTALQVTRGLLTRFRSTTTDTLLVAMSANGAEGAVSPSFRRMVRPRGPVVRRVLPPALRTVRPMVEALATGGIAAFPSAPNLLVATVDSVEARVRLTGGTNRPPDFLTAANMATLSAAQVGFQPVWFVTPPELPGTTIAAVSTAGDEQTGPAPQGMNAGIWDTFDSPQAANFRAATIAHQALIQPPQPPTYFSGQYDVDPITEMVLQRLDPTTTVPARASALVQFDGPRDTRDPLEPIMAAPEFTTPMYGPLRDLSQELLLPGLKEVEDNTVAILRPNPPFIEAYMVGLNHEFARELLWRDYPTDQRGSYFRQFWDIRGAIPAPGEPDFPPLHEWPSSHGLGDNLNPWSTGQLVLLLRGELLRRYPNPIVYAVRATGEASDPQLGAQEQYPLFRGSFEPDVAFFGFNLSEAQARGGGPNSDPGWFFLIQQHPTEPRFGLDVRPAEPYLHPQGNAATTALALTQRPVRVAIHATALLP
jgi:hypothetical protein